MRGVPEYPHQLLPDNVHGARARMLHLPPQPRNAYGVPSGACIGAGQVHRVLAQPGGARVYRVRKLCRDGEFATITQALAQWSLDKQGASRPRVALIEIGDNATYHEAPHIVMDPHERLELRAASMAQPVLRMFDYHRGVPEHVRISGAPGSELTIDGILVAGGGIEIGEHQATAPGQPAERACVTLRHCTLVPGWEAQGPGAAPWCGKASIVVCARDAGLRIDRSIVGPIRAARRGGLLALRIQDSIVDAGHEAGLAVADDGHGSAMARARIVRSTVIGLVQVEEVVLAEDAVFLGPLLAVRRDVGQVAACYVAPGSRTPPRARCQPDMAREGERVRPRYITLHYGAPGYCQLAPGLEEQLVSGCDDDADLMAPDIADYFVLGCDAPCLAGAPN